MSLRLALILLTVISVVCDTLLLPFYPQFFASEFAISNATLIGLFVANCCITVMLALPLWAKVAKKYNELALWLVTQVVAAGFGLLCYFATNVWEFWIYYQLMLVLKASYLLIYPFALRLEQQTKHLSIIGLFSVLMHFGAIGGALIGGYFFSLAEPRYALLLSSAGDLVQVLLCAYLMYSLKTGIYQQTIATEKPRERIPYFIWQFCFLSVVVYFSAFLIRPFFTTHWQALNAQSSTLQSAVVYAIPAFAALVMLVFNHFRQHLPLPTLSRTSTLLCALILGALGLYLQAQESVGLVILSRVLYGFALFQVMVLLEVMLFAKSEPAHYGSDFAKVHIAQNIGVILASLLVGMSVEHLSTTVVFYFAAIGFASLAFILLWRVKAVARTARSAS
ncbi:MAG: DHA1 family multidrug resistance protein-like MFS transporter [Pseudoalteromonas tetraodonis]|jgi:DHA1 family multidrug resistance protein-like MFS transporter|uniref:MFS transporter n=1 Tax=Pseudoalteromonas tetraodonis TaxID=43659 RepID=UPI003988CB2B